MLTNYETNQIADTIVKSVDFAPSEQQDTNDFVPLERQDANEFATAIEDTNAKQNNDDNQNKPVDNIECFDFSDDEFDNLFCGEFVRFSLNDQPDVSTWKCSKISSEKYTEQDNKHLTHDNFIETLKNYALAQNDPVLTPEIISITMEFLEKMVNGNTMLFDDFQKMYEIIIWGEPRVKQFGHFSVGIKSSAVFSGDIHGSIESVFFPLFVNGLFGENGDKKYIFLGDYLDRGPNGLECITTLMVLRFMFPNNVFLLRGNHEEISIYITYGTLAEIRKKFPDNISDSITFIDKFISFMSYSGVVHNKIFICHGMPSEHTSFRNIRNIDVLSDDNAKQIAEALMWSDPQETIHDVNVNVDNYDEVQCGSFANVRGSGYSVPWNVSQRFLRENNLDMIVRAHQCVMEGYHMSQPSVITLFGQPNYCNCGNKAGFMIVDIIGQVTTFSFTIDDVNKVIVNGMKKVAPIPNPNMDYF